MKLATSLESIQGAVRACLKCNGCTYGAWPLNETFCPLFARDACFTYSAGGLLFLSRAVLTGQMDYSQRLADLAFTCTACRACDGKCVIVRCINPDMALSDIIRLLRYELVKRGFVPKGQIKAMYDDVKKNGDLLAKGAKVLKIPDEIENNKADTVLVADCMHSDAAVKSLEAAMGLLEKMKRQIVLFADPGSCGSTLYDFGFWDALAELVQTKWDKIKRLGKKTLLFVDPHCQEFMTNKYASVIDDFSGFKGQHFSEALLEALNQGKLKSKKMKRIKVSYHDPCFLGRGLGIYDAPRQVLVSLQGVQLVEMKRNREQSMCCGARGLGGYFDDFAEGTARQRVNEFLDTKADVLITACPYCREALGKVLGEDGDRVQDLATFVSERVT